MLPFDVSLIMDIFNYAMIGIIAICALFGLWRGMKKSIYFMVWTCIVFLGGWFAMGTVCDFVMGYDLSSFGVIPDITVGENTYAVTTANALITAIVSDNLFGGADITDTVTLAFALGCVKMIIKLVWFMILCILNITVFKWLSDIIWFLFFRPRRKRDKETGKKLPKKKPNGALRLVGLGIGAVKGVCFVLIFCFFLSGIASIVSSAFKYEEQKTTLERYDVVLLSNTATVIREESTQNVGLVDNLIPEEYREIIDMICSYRDTVPGKIFGTVKIDGTPLDEYVFDGLFSVDVNTGDQKTTMSIKLRKELCTVAEVINSFTNLDPTVFENFSLNTIAELDSTEIAKAVEKLSSLEMVRLVVPVGIEVVMMSSLVDFSTMGEDVQKMIQDLDVEALKANDYAKDIQSLGYAFVDVCQLLKDQDMANIDPFSFNGELVEKLTEELGSLGILDIVAPVAVNYVLSMDSVKDLFNNAGLSVDDLKLDEITEWGKEIGNIGTIYSKFLETGITKQMIDTKDFSALDVEKVNGVVDAIFESQLLNNAIPVVVSYTKTFLPEEYKDMISIPEDVNWANELKPLMQSALTLLKTDILTSTDVMGSIGDLDDETIEKLGDYLSQSNILTGSLNGLINKLLAPEGGEGLLGNITITAFSQEEIDAGTAWTKEEITAIFKSAKVLISSGILTAEDKIASIKNIDTEALATNLSASTFFKRNLSGVMSSLMDSLATGESKMEITALTETEWTKTELSAIFNSLKEVVDMNLIGEGTDISSAMEALDDTKIDSLSTSLSSSVFFKRNFSSLINFLISGVDLQGIELGTLTEEDCNWTEMNSIFKSAKLLVSYATDESKNILDLLVATEQDLDPIMHSKLLSNALSSFIKNNESLKDTLKGADDVTSWVETYDEQVVEFTFENNTITFTTFATEPYFDVFVDGKYVGFTKTHTFVVAEGTTEAQISAKLRNPGELHKLFNAMGVLANGAIVDGNLNTDKLISNLISFQDTDIDTLTASVVIEATVSDKLEAMNGEGGLVVNPIVNLNAELKGMLKTVRLLFGDDADLNNLNFEVDDLLTKIINFTNDITSNGEQTVVIGGKVHNADEVGIMLSSAILSDTFISILNEQGASGTLTIPEYPVWKDNYQTPGELRKLISAISVLFKGDSTINVSSISANKLLSLNDSELDTMLASDILYLTVKDKIVDLSSGSDAVIVNESDISNWKIEIKNLIKAFNIVCSGGNLDNVNINANTLLALSDSDVSTITASIIFTDTAVHTLYTIDAIKMPTGLVETSSKWHFTGEALYPEAGELEQLIISMKALFGSGTVDTDNISADLILDRTDAELDTVLASSVILETVKFNIVALDTSNGGTSPSTIYVPSDISDWKVEIKALLGAVKILLKEDPVTHKKSMENATLEMDSILDTSNKNTLLASYIVSCTIVHNLEDYSSTLSLTRASYNWYGTDGELSKFIDSASLVLKDGAGNISLNNFNCDNLLNLKNDINDADNDDIRVLLASTVLRDTIAKNIIGLNGTLAIPSSLMSETADAWNDNGTTAGEIRNILLACKKLFGTSGSFDDADTFSVDSVLGKSKQDIQIILGNSLIIKNTVADKMVAIVYGGSMNGLIAEAPVVTGVQATDRKNYISADMVNMVYVMKDLDTVGISYSSITYASFTGAITTDAKAYLTADYITQSQVFTDSLPTMFKKIFTDCSFTVDLTNVFTVIDGLTEAQWKNSVNNTTYTYGELALMLRALSAFSDMDDATSLGSTALRNTMSKVNASKIMSPVMGDFVVKALSSVADWTRDSYTLTQVEWSYEIAVLADLLDTGCADTLELTGSNKISSATMGTIMGHIASSRILDINKFMGKVGDAVDGVFGSGTYVNSMPLSTAGTYTSNNTGALATVLTLTEAISTSTTESAITSVNGYTNADYNTFVSAWNTETTLLVVCIDKLNGLNLNFADKTATGDADTYQGAKNARGLGEFLDACVATNSLNATVANVLTKPAVTMVAPTDAELQTAGNYANAMALKAKNILALMP